MTLEWLNGKWMELFGVEVVAYDVSVAVAIVEMVVVVAIEDVAGAAAIATLDVVVAVATVDVVAVDGKETLEGVSLDEELSVRFD